MNRFWNWVFTLLIQIMFSRRNSPRFLWMGEELQPTQSYSNSVGPRLVTFHHELLLLVRKRQVATLKVSYRGVLPFLGFLAHCAMDQLDKIQSEGSVIWLFDTIFYSQFWIAQSAYFFKFYNFCVTLAKNGYHHRFLREKCDKLYI